MILFFLILEPSLSCAFLSGFFLYLSGSLLLLLLVHYRIIVLLRPTRLEFIPINGIDLGIKFPISALFALDLEVALRHVESRVSGKFVLTHTDKVFVVRNDDKLEVGLHRARGDDLSQGDGQTTLVGVIEVGRRLIQRHNTTVEAKGLGKGKADDNRSQDALAGTATASHIELRGTLGHNDAVVVGPSTLRGTLGARNELNVGDVLTLVSERPELADNLVDIGDLHAVITQEGVVQGLVIFSQIFPGGLGSDIPDHALTVTLIDVLIILSVELSLEELDLVLHALTTARCLVLLVFILADQTTCIVVLLLGIVRSLDELDLFVDLGLLRLQIRFLGNLLEYLDVVLQIFLVARLIIELFLQSVESWDQFLECLLLFGDPLLVLIEIVGETALSLLLVGIKVLVDLGIEVIQHLRIALKVVEVAVEPALLRLIRLAKTLEVDVLRMELSANGIFVLLELLFLVTPTVDEVAELLPPNSGLLILLKLLFF
mmetsp:Transcript_22803/g.65754  ORF Transcript_22803/g.65754 Transcript_22803/m.65754 type:complete len:488 (+) Transcript_22803:56-1519(+)